MQLTQVAFAELIGSTANTVARWERDEIGMRSTTERLIRLVTAPPIRPDADPRNADWIKFGTPDIDQNGKPIRRKATRKGGR